MTKTTTKVQAHIRWMIRRDLPQVVAIEAQSGENHWTEQQLLHYLGNRIYIGMVCVDSQDTVLAYMIYQLHENRLDILNLTVNPKVRRKSIGFHMMQKLKSKLSEHKRTMVEMTVRESNLEGQLFLRAMGFDCDDIVRNGFDDGDEQDSAAWEDGYHFLFTLNTN